MPTNTVEAACGKYIHAVIRAKGRAENEEAFWKDRKSNAAYTQLEKAVDARVGPGFHWWYTVWNLAGEVADNLWHTEECDEASETERFVKSVLAHLDALKGHDWVASLPLEHLFNGFPTFTDFGSFYLVNVDQKEGERPDDTGGPLKRFRDVLTDKLGVKVGAEDDKSQSYLNLGGHYCRKSNGYIPGRPQMVMKVGVGDEFVNKSIFAKQARYQVALLAICQIAYELEAGPWHTNVISPGQCRLPMGEWMQDGLIEVPNSAVAIVASTGHASLWTIPQMVYETQYGRSYDPDKFMAIWNDLAAPLANIRHALSGNVGEAIRNAVSLVAKCRHYIMGDLLLNSVIATEALLNPFNKMGTSEGFGIFAAKLAGKDVDERLLMYANAKRLYNMRSLTVHQARGGDEKALKEYRTVAFNLFRGCFKAILQWVRTQLDKGGQCDEDQFKEFYMRTILA